MPDLFLRVIRDGKWVFRSSHEDVMDAKATMAYLIRKRGEAVCRLDGGEWTLLACQALDGKAITWAANGPAENRNREVA